LPAIQQSIAYIAAREGDGAIGVKGVSLMLTARNGEDYVAHVLPLARGGASATRTARLLRFSSPKRDWQYLRTLRAVAFPCTIAIARIRIPIQPMIGSPAAYAIRCRRGTACDLPGAFDVPVDLFKMRHYCPTYPGQINARWRMDKELAAEFSFKSLKGRAQRWLCDVASLRSAREAQLFACGEEIFHLRYFHGRLALVAAPDIRARSCVRDKMPR
jgi:hypothetical protein